jgi:hypothetical protein
MILAIKHGDPDNFLEIFESYDHLINAKLLFELISIVGLIKNHKIYHLISARALELIDTLIPEYDY